jgi:hypothetical protein
MQKSTPQRRSPLRPARRVMLVVTTVFGITLALMSGCAKVQLIPDTTVAADPGVEPPTPEQDAQTRVDLVMAALGDAYRTSIAADGVNDASLASLSDGFAGTAYDAEEANLRDAMDARNALARAPENPTLAIDIITEGTDKCQVAKAVFDDRPLLAFPTAGAGLPVFVRLVLDPEQPIWRIDVLASEAQLSGREVACSDASNTNTTLVPRNTSTSTSTSLP